MLPEAKYQRCTAHFCRNGFSVTPHSNVKMVDKMLKVIHTHENKKTTREKFKAVVSQSHYWYEYGSNARWENRNRSVFFNAVPSSTLNREI